MSGSLAFVVGATGFLGQRMIAQLQEAGTPVSAYGRRAMQFPCGVRSEICDVTDADALARLAERIAVSQPSSVFYLAAQTAYTVQEGSEEAQTMHTVNVEAPVVLAAAAAQAGATFVFTSSDMVFDGDHAPYAVTDDPNPVTFYGRSKLEAETALLEAAGETSRLVIVRCPLMYGLGGSFVNVMHEKLLAGESLDLFDDEYRTPALASDVVAGLLVLAAAVEPGSPLVVHLGGPERVSRLDMGEALVRAMVAAGSLSTPVPELRGVHVADVVKAVRPRDIALDSSDGYALLEAAGGVIPRGLDEGMAEMLREGVFAMASC